MMKTWWLLCWRKSAYRLLSKTVLIFCLFTGNCSDLPRCFVISNECSKYCFLLNISIAKPNTPLSMQPSMQSFNSFNVIGILAIYSCICNVILKVNITSDNHSSLSSFARHYYYYHFSAILYPLNSVQFLLRMLACVESNVVPSLLSSRSLFFSCKLIGWKCQKSGVIYPAMSEMILPGAWKHINKLKVKMLPNGMLLFFRIINMIFLGLFNR